MSNLYDILSSLCNKNGITGYRMCKDLGIQPSVMTDLKMGRRSSVKAETAQKIADYFGVSVGYLLGTEAKGKTPALTEKDKRDAAKEVERIMGDLENSGELMFDGVPISPEARESMAAAMKLGLEAARLKNKETYTPKKYRK